MPPIPIAIDDTNGHQVQILLRKMTRLQKIAVFKGHHDSVDRRNGMLMGMPNKVVRTITYSGISCTFTYDPGDANLALKKKVLKEALGQLQGQTGYAPPRNEIDVYCTTSAKGISASSNASIGYTYMDRTNAELRLKVALILGDSVANPPAMIVANQIKEYYKPTLTVKSGEKAALAAVFHEFGHIFHQIHKPNHYFALANLNIIIGAGAGGYAAHAGMVGFPGPPSFAALTAFQTATQNQGRTVSTYASTHPCELVAEVFSSLLMGAPVDPDAFACYTALGGPQPTTGMCHVRKGQGGFKKKVLYPIAKAIRSIGDGT